MATLSERKPYRLLELFAVTFVVGAMSAIGQSLGATPITAVIVSVLAATVWLHDVLRRIRGSGANQEHLRAQVAAWQRSRIAA